MSNRTLIVPALALMLAAAACTTHADAPKAAKRPTPPVTVAGAFQQDIPLEIRAIGNGEAYSTVAIKSRIPGELVKSYVAEGSDVKQGELLFQIDPRPYEHQIDQIKAAIAKDIAAEKQAIAATARDRSTAANAKSQSDRYTTLFKSGVASREQTEQYQTSAQAAEDVVRADEANIAAAQEATKVDRARLSDAELSLTYTRIQAPISGRLGNINLKAGNMIKDQSDTPLTVINQINPIYVTFAVPEAALAEIRTNSARNVLRVQATPQGSADAETGKLAFIDNAVDPATGTIKLKAVFNNANHRLWPGQFANVVLTLGTQHNAILVPTSAVQAGQKGRYVFVVDADLTARERLVTIGPIIGPNTVISSGLQPGEKVITDGQLSVVPNNKVEIIQRRSALHLPPFFAFLRLGEKLPRSLQL